MKKLLLLGFCLTAMQLVAQNADIDLLRKINLGRNPHCDRVLVGVTNSAGPLTFGLPLVLLGFALIRKDRTLRQQSLYLGASVLSSALFTNIIKYSVDRTRPFVAYPELEKLSSGGGPSFPSGHTSDAFAIATAVSLTWPRWYVIVPAYSWAALVGWSRLALGVHYPSDVLMGALMGAGASFLCYKGQQWLQTRAARRKARE